MLPQVEIRRSGRLHGVMLTEGRAASGGRREVFAPGSVEWPSTGVGILTAHRAAPELRAVPERRDNGEIHVEATATPEIRRAVEAGRRYMSVEFHSLRERTTKGGVREILRALVPDVALVDNPEYDTTRAEVRRRLGPSIKSTVPYEAAIDCDCPGDGCDTIYFELEAFEQAAKRRALATTGRMDQSVGHARMSATRAGLEIDVDLLDVTAADDLVSLIESGIDVYARPLLALELSTFSESRNRTRYVKQAVFDAILIKPVAGGVDGMEPVRLTGRSRRVEGRRRASTRSQAILAASRRRIWL